MRRYELSDVQWDLIADLFPVPKGGRGRPSRPHRDMMNGILWILLSGAAWRDLPERFGPWKTVYDRFRKWQRDGTFDKVLDRLRMKLDEDGLLDFNLWMVDSTTARAHRSAAGARKKKKN